MVLTVFYFLPLVKSGMVLSPGWCEVQGILLCLDHPERNAKEETVSNVLYLM